MKMSAFSGLVRKTGHCTTYTKPEEITAQREVLMSNGHAIYRCEAMPEPKTENQTFALLDVSKKQADKISLSYEEYESLEDVDGFDLSDGVSSGELDTERDNIEITYKGNSYTALKCSDGEIIFYNPQYLAPLKEKIDSPYFKLVARVYQNGSKRFNYVLAKDGLSALAAILPISILSEEFITNLKNFTDTCESQYMIDSHRAEMCRMEKESKKVTAANAEE